MKERPILFSAPMVRALLEGRKAQTRRVVKHNGQAITDQNASWMHAPIENGSVVGPMVCDARGLGQFLVRCPYGVPGDRLWVRETWGCKDADRPGVPGGRKPQLGDSIQYAENGADAWQWRVPGSLPWRPSIHMPRWASRILLEVTDVRVQRVQDITGNDVEAEGCEFPDGDGIERLLDRWAPFRQLWDSINAKRGFGWAANPWVWAITFRRIENVP